MLAAITALGVLACTSTAAPVREVGAAELLGLRDLSGISVSPDATRVAVQVQQADADANAYASSWCVVDLAGSGEVTRAGDGGDIAMPSLSGLGRRSGVWLTLAARWSPDSAQIAFIATRDGGAGIEVCTASGGGCRALVRNDGAILDIAWSADGRTIIYEAGEPQHLTDARMRDEALTGFRFDHRFDVWHQWTPVREAETRTRRHRAVDLTDAAPRDATDAERRRYMLARPAPSSASIGASRSITASALAQVERPPLPAGSDIRGVARIGETGAVWTEPADSGRAGLAPPLRLHARIDEDAAPLSCAREACTGSIVEFAPTRDHRRVLFIRREGWAGSSIGLYLWTPAAGEVATLLQTSDVIRACTALVTRAICFHEGPTRPRTVISIDFATGAITTVFDPNPHLARDAFIEARRIEWRDAEAGELFGWLVAPARRRNERLPLIIVQYRATGFLRGGVGDEHPIQAFARRGFAVLALERPDPVQLMSTIRDGEELDRLEWRDLSERRRTLAALRSAIAELVRLGIADPDRVGITGLSDGAETALFAAIHCSCAQALAVSNGFHDPLSYYFSSDSGRRSMTDEGRGDALRDAGLWRELSPALNVDRIHAPVLVQIADRELSFALQSQAAFADARRPFDLYVFPDEYHVKWQPAHRRAVYQRSLDWFEFWLMGREREDPRVREQYLRWRSWRDALQQTDD